MTILQVGLLFIGVVVLLGFLCWCVIKAERKFPTDKYDERQLLARGRAYRLCFWIGFAYDLFVMVHAISRGWESSYILFFFGLSLRAMTFHLYCLFTGSALPLAEKPTISTVGYAGLALMNFARLLKADIHSPLTFAREDTQIWLGLSMGVVFASLSIMHLLSRLRQEKE